ncbi:hypothetical protein H257_04077 [Aphanomyces astaci]|uniref:Protein kinase domain-containing protein n=1 Tax=Aphanomyces astaci TaxID=112090 RepID=W4GVI5_APHAT|nr:hypothetical protein H257_04077 [Aphanomyces astaci]ETV83326.1 hypothetical protein H257_04077 [Aphanomyces astaci]|eukprot:XP_009826756.1 hypothetical protein H257_04077 [Aphanomyces astaci]
MHRGWPCGGGGDRAEHSKDHKKKFLSKSQALATSKRTDLLKTHHVFGFAIDASKTKSALKAIAKRNKAAASASKSKKGVAKIGKAKKQCGMTTSAKAEAFTSGSSTLLTTCNYGATMKCAFWLKKTDVLDITVIPSSFETVNFADLDRDVKLVGQTVPIGTRVLKVTKARVRGYPDKDFNNLHLPPSMETLDFSDNQLEVFNPSEWAELPLTELYGPAEQRLEQLNNVTFSPTLHTIILADNWLKRFTNGTQFPAALKTLCAIQFLTTLEDLPPLPFRLKKLFLIGDTLMRYVVSSDTYNRLNDVNAVTVPAMIAPCPDGSLKSPTQPKANDVFVCVAASSSGSSSTLPLVLGLVGGTVCIAASAMYAYSRHMDNKGNHRGFRSISPPPLIEFTLDGMTTHTSSSSNEPKRRQYPPAAENGHHQQPRVSHAKLSSDRRLPSSSVGLPEFPRLLQQHPSLQPYAIACDSVDDLCSFVGDTSIGALGSQRVVVKPLFSDHQVDVFTMYTTVAHPKIVSLMGETWDISGSLSIVMPFYGRGCLRSMLFADAVPLGPLSGSPVKLGLAIDAAEVLMFHHFLRHPFVHLNVSASAVYVNDHWTAALRLPGVDRGHVGVRKPWVIPEILRASSPHTPKADLECSCDNDVVVLSDDKLTAFGMQCLDLDPTKRPSAMDAVYELRNLLHLVVLEK